MNVVIAPLISPPPPPMALFSPVHCGKSAGAWGSEFSCEQWVSLGSARGSGVGSRGGGERRQVCSSSVSHRRRFCDDEASHLHRKVVGDVAVDHPGPGVVQADTHNGPAAWAHALLTYVLGRNPVVLAIGKQGDHVAEGRVLEVQQALQAGAGIRMTREGYCDALGYRRIFFAEKSSCELSSSCFRGTSLVLLVV